MDTGYDTVIVGGGSAGCVLAARLSEDADRRVLLVEAGPDYPVASLPADLADGIHGTSTASHDWGLSGVGAAGTAPQRLPRGRVTGGSSAVNATFALRGHPADYDGWGLPGWSFEEVLPSFVRLERDLDFGSADYHGTTGPLPIRRYLGAEASDLTATIEAAIAGVGVPRIADHNAPGAVGVSALPVTCLDGRRLSTATAYLEPARTRPNLTIRADRLVDEVVLRGGRAVGVRTSDGAIVSADEVILAAGAYGSPGLLVRSGVGPGADLAALGRDTVVDLPGVGADLADHPWVSIDLPCAAPEGDPAVFQLVATLRSSHAAPSGPPDLQLMICGPYPLGDGYACSVAAALLQPVSRGRVHVGSLDPEASPTIDLGYLAEPADLDRLLEGVRLADAVTQDRGLLRATGGSRLGPTRELIADDDAARAWMRASAASYHHPVGTCAMGLDSASGSVVDPDGSVYGVDGLSVIDASVLPGPPSANTNLPVIMLAEHLAARRWPARRPAAVAADQGLRAPAHAAA